MPTMISWGRNTLESSFSCAVRFMVGGWNWSSQEPIIWVKVSGSLLTLMAPQSYKGWQKIETENKEIGDMHWPRNLRVVWSILFISLCCTLKEISSNPHTLNIFGKIKKVKRINQYIIFYHVIPHQFICQVNLFFYYVPKWEFILG